MTKGINIAIKQPYLVIKHDGTLTLRNDNSSNIVLLDPVAAEPEAQKSKKRE